MDNQQFAAYMADVKKRAEALLGESHHNESAHRLARDLLQLAASFSSLQTDSVSVGADARLLKRRLDQAKTDQKNLEKKIEQIRTISVNFILPLKQMLNQVDAISEKETAALFRAGLKHITDGVIEMTKISG